MPKKKGTHSTKQCPHADGGHTDRFYTQAPSRRHFDIVVPYTDLNPVLAHANATAPLGPREKLVGFVGTQAVYKSGTIIRAAVLAQLERQPAKATVITLKGRGYRDASILQRCTFCPHMPGPSPWRMGDANGLDLT